MKLKLLTISLILALLFQQSGECLAPQAASKRVLIDINSATKEELMTLPGIGPLRADLIIEGRAKEAGRGFALLPEDIIAIPGIGLGIYEKIRPFITAGDMSRVPLGKVEGVSTLPEIIALGQGRPIPISEFEGLVELTFDDDTEVGEFLRQQIALIDELHYSYAETTTQSELCDFLRRTSLPDGRTLDSLRTSLGLVSKLTIKGTEYTWIASLWRWPFLEERFYAGSEWIAHGDSRIGKEIVGIRMGMNFLMRGISSLRHKGHMQVLFNMKQAVLKDTFPITAFRVKFTQIRSWDAFFFYIKKGYLPIDPKTRKVIIQKFLIPWLKNRKRRVENPDRVFGKDFFDECGDFMLFLTDPRSAEAPVAAPQTPGADPAAISP